MTVDSVDRGKLRVVKLPGPARGEGLSVDDRANRVRGEREAQVLLGEASDEAAELAVGSDLPVLSDLEEETVLVRRRDSWPDYVQVHS